MMIPLIITGALVMIIEFTSDIGDAYKSGHIMELADDKARTLIAMGQARESDSLSLLRAANKSDLDGFKKDLLGEIRALKGGGNGNHKPAPPPTGGTNWSGTESSEERGADGRKARTCFGDFCRCVFFVQARNAPQPLADWAARRLQNVYGAERCDYEIDEATGEISRTVNRSLDWAGSVARTGTESLSGGATYGFAVRPEYMANLFEIAMEQSVFAEAAFPIPMGTTNELRWPALDQYNAPTTAGGIKQAASFGGFTIQYAGETTPRTASDAALSDITFKIVDLTGFTSLSRDLLADNYIAMDAMATRVFARAFVFMEDYMAIYGDGVGKPQGFWNSPALLTVSRGTASHIEYEDIVGMMAKLHPQCWQGARWLTHSSCLPDLVAIKNHAGNLVYQPNTQISQAMFPSVIGQSSYDRAAKIARPQGVLEGIPLYITEKVSALGTQGDLNLVCPSEYGMARREGLEVGLSEHFYFDTDRIAMRFKKRHDGKSLWRNSYTQLNGTTKTSPFVQLV